MILNTMFDIRNEKVFKLDCYNSRNYDIYVLGQENAEQSFLSKAIMANQYEIALAQQTGERSSSESVKAYAQMLVDDQR